MQTANITLEQSLEQIAILLRKRQYEQALENCHQLSQAAMRQQLQLILQRYLAELCMECLELSGQLDTALQFCEHSLDQYSETKTRSSAAAQKDYISLSLRKICLLIKLNNHNVARQFSQIFLHSLTREQQERLRIIINRLHRYPSAAQAQLIKEQRQIGLFHLSDNLIKEGANILRS